MTERIVAASLLPAAVLGADDRAAAVYSFLLFGLLLVCSLRCRFCQPLEHSKWRVFIGDVSDSSPAGLLALRLFFHKK
jgi:hypothetical protein